MRQCHHNEYVGLRNRYLKDTPVLNTNIKKRVNSYCDELLALMMPNFTGKISIEEFFETKRGAIRQRYLGAAHEILKRGFDINKDNDISAFIKNEKYVEMKPPRMIMGRNPKFNIYYGLYTIPMEKAIAKLPQFVKGCDFMERGEKFSALVGEWYVENDYSKFESSQRVLLLDWIEKYMLSKLYPDDKTIMSLYEAKLWKNGRTPSGIRFKFQGCRGSGDMDTGLFNSILNWIACRYFEDSNHTGHSGMFIVDGDDGVIRWPRGKEVAVNSFLDFGFDAKLIIRKDYHDVDFCSSKFIQIRPGVYYQVQNLNKILSYSGYMINTEFRNSLSDYYGSLGYMLACLYPFPVFRDVATFMMSCSNAPVNMRILEKINPTSANVFSMRRHIGIIDEPLIRAEIALSFDLPHHLQFDLSNYLTTNKLNFENIPFKARIRQRYRELTSVDYDMMRSTTIHIDHKVSRGA